MLSKFREKGKKIENLYLKFMYLEENEKSGFDNPIKEVNMKKKNNQAMKKT